MPILSKPVLILRQSFLEFIHEQKITRFSAKNVMEWYRFHKSKLNQSFSEKSLYPAVHRQIIHKLLFEGKIRRKSRGIYEVINIENEMLTKHPELKEKELGDLAEEKWRKLSGQAFNPDKLLTEETLEVIRK